MYAQISKEKQKNYEHFQSFESDWFTRLKDTKKEKMKERYTIESFS